MNTSKPEWVALSGVSPTAHSLYEKLMMHASRPDSESPAADHLALLLGLSRGDKVRPYLDELVAIGAARVRRAGTAGRNVYTAYADPPAGYTGPLTLEDWYAGRQCSIVYYVWRALDGAIKIGYTAGGVRHRLTKIARRNGHVELLASEPGGAELETRRHRQFAGFWMEPNANGETEWFRSHPALTAHVASLAVPA